MKTVRILAPVVIIILLSIMVFMLSCGGGGTGSSLEGTWTLTTTPDPGNPAFGNGTYILTLIESSTQLEMDLYFGEGTIEGVPYNFRVQSHWDTDIEGNKYYLFLSEEAEVNPINNKIKCYSPEYTVSSVSGQYRGEGTYSNYTTGTFHSIKQ